MTDHPSVPAVAAPQIFRFPPCARKHRSDYPEDLQVVGDVLELWDADGFLTNGLGLASLEEFVLEAKEAGRG